MNGALSSDRVMRETWPPLRAVRPRPTALAAAQTTAMVLAGGRGERLAPLTDERAKPAVPFGAVHRMVDFTLANCLNSGIRSVHLLTQYQSASLEQHVERSWRLDPRGRRVGILAADEKAAKRGYRGTADAVHRNLDTLVAERPRWVLVLGGDHLYQMDYREMLAAHAQSGADVTIAATQVPLDEARRMGVMSADSTGRVEAFDEKPEQPRALDDDPSAALVSMGIYVFSRDALFRELALDAARETQHDFGRDVIPSMLRAGARVFAFRFRDYWRDIGTIDAYYDASLDLLAQTPALDLDDPVWPIASLSRASSAIRISRGESGVRGVFVDSLAAPGVRVAGGNVRRSILGPRAEVSSGAEVEDAIVFGGVAIGRRAIVRRAILDEGVRVAPGASIGEDLERDRRRFTVTDHGVVVVPRGTVVDA